MARNISKESLTQKIEKVEKAIDWVEEKGFKLLFLAYPQV